MGRGERGKWRNEVNYYVLILSNGVMVVALTEVEKREGKRNQEQGLKVESTF
jgi:hypothetical protein